MGLAYFFLFIMILGAAGAAVALLVLAWIIWKKSRFKIFFSHPCAFGCALRCCSILLIGNRLERAALGVPFLIG